MTLGLLIAIFIASRRADYRDIAKLSLAPGIFNINEPVIFGLPIVLNPIMVIPFIITPAINTLIGYFFISTNLFHLSPIKCLDNSRTTDSISWYRRKLARASGRLALSSRRDSHLSTIRTCI